MFDRKTGVEIYREKVLAGRKAELDHHVLDGVPEADAIGKKIIRAKRTTSERVVAMQIAALEGKRDDYPAMTPTLTTGTMVMISCSRANQNTNAGWTRDFLGPFM